MKARTLAAAVAAAAMAVTLTSGPAQAHRSPQPPKPPVTNVKTVATGLASPLKVAFGPHGSYVVAESFAGQLTRISKTGKKTNLYTAIGHEIAGASTGNGKTYFFDNDPGNNPEGPPTELLPALLKSIDHRGNARTLADLSKYEGKHNPDGKTVYGVRYASKACLVQAPYMRSMGELYSHPYSSTPSRSGVYVGDAGANVILHVNKRGKTSLVKKLAPERVKLTPAVIAGLDEMGMKVPDCMAGLNYYAQPVPTDIEVKGSWLYYTVLPGAPGESASVGKAYRMHLRSGRTETLATGLSGPTGIAVSDRGTVYVGQLFGEGVVRLDRGKKTKVLDAVMSGDVEIRGNKMAVTTMVLADPPAGGSLLSMRIRW